MIKKLLTAGIGLFLLSCQSPEPVEGPYFANGVKNGWADQNSIVLWTRLTQNKSANFKGHPFIEISREKMKSLAQNQDVEGIYNTQIPEGLSLKDMEGYCPGASGEVQLHYYLNEDPAQAIVTDWVAVDSSKDFTHQWKLNSLQAGKKYRLKIYARPQKGQKISDSIFGQF
ncbi:MAG: hypothetical protein VYD13_04020, partial [Bacteroidota bacterium]|nr:hypothetical protein [Bacteroidota bacterium]